MLNKAGGIKLPDFKLYFKAIVIKTIWHGHLKRTHKLMEQNRVPKIKPTLLCSIIFQQRSKKNIQWGTDSLFNVWC